MCCWWTALLAGALVKIWWWTARPIFIWSNWVTERVMIKIAPTIRIGGSVCCLFPRLHPWLRLVGHGPLPHSGDALQIIFDIDMDTMIAVVCRVHGARSTLWISTSCFAAFSKKGESHCPSKKLLSSLSLSSPSWWSKPSSSFLPGLLLGMAGTFSCLCLERGELQMESDDNDHQSEESD